MADADDKSLPLAARLLGRTELRLGDRQLTDADWPRRSARHLLLLLLISPGHALPRDRVVDLIWPEAAPDTTANLVAIAIHRLRRALEPELASGRGSRFVETAGGSIRLHLPAGSRIDADAFESDLRAARHLPELDRREPLRAALASYAGDLVADEPYLDWLVPRREQLAQLRQSAVIELAALDLAAAQPLAAEPALLDLLRDDPALEPAHRAMIRAYAASNQPEAARRQLAACRASLAEHLGVEPAGETLAALDQPPLSHPTVAHVAPVSRSTRVPAPPTRLIGRRRELDEIADAILGGQSRLVTLVGPGGIGKTHLAQEAARVLEGDFADGVAWAPLAALRDPNLVPAAIARALGVADDGGRSLEDTLVEVVADRAILLVVDNLEQVIDAAPILATILAASPGSAVLATSRQRLHLRGEREVEVPPLPPVTDGVALFLARAAEAGVHLDSADDRLPGVAEICRRLDGIPLAIELAAGASRRLPIDALSDQLGHRLDLLVDGPRDADERQRTMRAAIAWSDDLLTLDQQTTFRRLGVFAGGSPHDLIEAVVTRSDWPTPLSPATTALDEQLAALTEAHLLRREESDAGPRYLMLETVRAYAVERLVDASELESTAAAHLAAVVALAQRAAAGLVGPDQIAWLDRLETDHDNLRAAVTWAIDRGDDAAIRIVADTWRFFSTRGHGAEWADRSDAAVAVAEEVDDFLAGRGLRAAGILRDDLDDYDGAESRYQAALERLPPTAATAELRGQLANDLGNLDRNRSRYPEARDHYEQAVEIALTADLPQLRLSAETNLANIDMFQGRLDEAADRMRGLLATTDDPYHRRILRSNLALLHIQREDFRGARPLLEEVLVAVRAADDREGIADALAMLADSLDRLGEPGGAALRDEAITRFAALGDRAGEVAARAAQFDALRAAGDPRAVFAAAEQALALVRPVDDRAVCLDLLDLLGSPLVDAGRPELAALLIGVVEAVRGAHDLPRSPKDQRAVDELRGRLVVAMTPDALAGATTAGVSLPLDACVAEALAACRDILSS